MLEHLLADLPHLKREIDQALSDVTDAVATFRGPGELTIKIKLTPQGSGERVDLTPTVVAKAPREVLPTSVHYVSPDGELTARDPRQMDINEVINP